MRIAVAGSSGLIGSQVCRLAGEAGHEVVRLSRTDGVDLLDPDAVAKALVGVEAVVDVSRPSRMDLASAREFFTTVARNLGAAGREAGVRRTVVLSIVGVDRGQDYDWYVATLAHEQAIREHALGASVLRTTQFHEFPGQSCSGRWRDGPRPGRRSWTCRLSRWIPPRWHARSSRSPPISARRIASLPGRVLSGWSTSSVTWSLMTAWI